MIKRVSGAAMLALVVLGGCHGGPKGVFAGRKGPDEFVVGRAAPLVVPPDFALVPPRPGQPRPQEADSSTQALNVLFGGQARRSPGETTLAAQAGTSSDPGIRSDVGNDAPTTVNKGAATRDIVNAPPSSNPQAEATTPK